MTADEWQARVEAAEERAKEATITLYRAAKTAEREAPATPLPSVAKGEP